MKMPVADVVDRYTILLIKKSHGLKVPDEELEAYRVESCDHDYMELLNINRQMWDLEEQITKADEAFEVGLLYWNLRDLTKRRVEAKNRISERCGQHLELKSY